MTSINYHLYEDGNIGMCNAMMSVENALIIALLNNNSYVNFLHSGSIFNSEKGLNIFDLFIFDYDIRHNQNEKKDVKLQFDFHDTVFYREKYPSREFINNRSKIFQIGNYLEFETFNSNTLGFYSYLFSFSDKEKEHIHNFISGGIFPRLKYTTEAKKIIEKLGDFNCINPRRGDYLLIPGNNNATVNSSEFLPVMSQNFNSNPVLIVSDETDKSYFSPISERYKLHFIQDYISDEFDLAEKGLIAMIVASHSKRFIGTLKSTFSAYIQRNMRIAGRQDEFIFLYSQNGVKLYSGHFDKQEGENSWNRAIYPKDIEKSLFWFREWEESYKFKNTNYVS